MRTFAKRCAGAIAALLFSCAAFAQIGYLGPIVGSSSGFIIPSGGSGTWTSGQLKGPDGTACTSPTYSFSSSTNTGLTIDGTGVTLCYGGVKGVTATSGNIYVKGPLSIGNGTLNTAPALLISDAAETLAQRNGTSPQIFRIYNTFTDASNYERGQFVWNGNNFDIQSTQAGTGTARQMRLYTTGSAKLQLGVSNALQWEISTGGAFEPVTDGSPDIGATSNRVKDFIGARLRSSQATAPTCTSNCGTSPTVAGGDTAGIVTMGATGVPASGWVVTFNGTWGAAPSCVVQSALTTMVVGKMPIAVQTTTTTMTVTTNGTAPANADKYAYHCIGVQ